MPIFNTETPSESSPIIGASVSELRRALHLPGRCSQAVVIGRGVRITMRDAAAVAMKLVFPGCELCLQSHHSSPIRPLRMTFLRLLKKTFPISCRRDAMVALVLR